MKRVDARIPDLFRHIRSSVDILEQIMLHPYQPPREPLPPVDNSKLVVPQIQPAELAKWAYTIREIATLVGISRASLYRVMNSGELRSMKVGRRTLVRTPDLQAWMESWPQASPR